MGTILRRRSSTHSNIEEVSCVRTIRHTQSQSFFYLYCRQRSVMGLVPGTPHGNFRGAYFLDGVFPQTVWWCTESVDRFQEF